MVNALMVRAAALSIDTTRRQARKMLNGRGSLADKLRAAEVARTEGEAP